MHSPFPILGLVYALLSATAAASPASSPFPLDVSAVEVSQFLALRATDDNTCGEVNGKNL